MHKLAPLPSGPILKTPRVKNLKHLKFVSTLPCVVTGREGVQVAHLRSPCLSLGKRHTGRSEKPDDRFVLPLTPEMHERQHSMNEVKFWALHGFTWEETVQLALDIHKNSGDYSTCLRLIAMARR